MTGLPENIEELLTELVEKSRHEMNIMLALADAIRRTDEQLLREVQSVTISHEMRRAEIRGELQALSARLCALPNRTLADRSAEQLHKPRHAIANGANGSVRAPRGEAHNAWTQPADEIEAELNEVFGSGEPRH